MALDPAFQKQIEDYAKSYSEQLERDEATYAKQGLTQLSWQMGDRSRDTLKIVPELLSRLDKAGIGPENFQLAKDYITYLGSGTSGQALNELEVAGAQRTKQNQQLLDFRNRAETQLLGAPGATMEQALLNPASELGSLGGFLKKQQSDIFQQELSPLIKQNMASMGLLDSGANIEQQAKALGGLERARQGSLFQAALGAKEGIRNLEQRNILGDIGSQQQAMTGMFDLQRSNITMEFQRSLARERDNLTRELNQYRGGGWRQTFSDINLVTGTVGNVASLGLFAKGQYDS